MADEAPATPVATEPVRPADAGNTTPQPQAPAPAAPAASTTPAQPSNRDWNATAERIRTVETQNAVITQQLVVANQRLETFAKLLGNAAPTASTPAPAPQAPAPVAPPTAPVQQVQAAPQESELAVKFAFSEAIEELSDDYSLSKAQRKAVLPLFQSSDKSADALKGILDSLGIGKKAAPPTVAPTPAPAPTPTPPPNVPQATTRSDTGPPGTTAGEISLANATEEQLLAMDPAARRRLFETDRQRTGGYANNSPFTRALPPRITNPR